MTSNTNICSPMERLDIVKHRGKVLPFQSCDGFSFAYTWRNWLGLTTDLDIVGLRHLGFYMFFTQTQQDCRLALFLWRNTACYKHGNIVFLLFSLLFSLEHTKASSLHSCVCLGHLAAIYFGNKIGRIALWISCFSIDTRHFSARD